MILTLEDLVDSVEYSGSIPCDCGQHIRLMEHAVMAWCRGCGLAWEVDWEESVTRRVGDGTDADEGGFTLDDVEPVTDLDG